MDSAVVMPQATAAATVESDSARLLARTARGAGWVIGWRLATRGLGLLNTLILVRLLTPADFGLVALGTSFAIAVDALSELGVEEAIIRERRPGRAFYDTGFTMNACRGMATAALIAAAALPAARFFHEPRLLAVMLALAGGSLCTAFTSIGIVDFQRHLDFRQEFRLLVLPRIMGILVTITVAFALRSYWALIAGILTGRILGVALGYRMHPYRPRFSVAEWRRLASFSIWSWTTSIVGLVRDRADAFVIGRLLDPMAVGLFAVGSEIALLPTTELVAPLCRACLPGFSAARHSGFDTAESYRRVIATMALLVLPAGAGVSLIAAPVVRLAFGSGWDQATPVIRLLGLAGALTLVGFVGSTLFNAHAMLRSIFNVTLASAVVRVVLLIPLVARFGLVGGAVAVALAIAAEQLLYLALTLRRFGISPLRLLHAIWRCVMATATMAVALLVCGLVQAWEPGGGRLAMQVAGAIGLGAATYAVTLGTLWLACGRPGGAEADLVSLLRRVGPARRGRSEAGMG